MRNSLLSRALVVAGVIAVSIYLLTAGRNIRLGADLRGGMHLTVQVAWREAWKNSGEPDAAFRELVMRQTRDVILKKVNALGLSEATVQPVGRSGTEDQFLIEVPGVDDPARVKRVIGTAAVLEWVDVKDGPFAGREEAYARNGGVLSIATRLRRAPDGAWWLLAKSAVVQGTDLRDAGVSQSSRGWATSFVLSQAAAQRFEAYTAANIGRRAAILLDDKILSVPLIEGKIRDSGEIVGARTRDEAAELALNLRAGSLPARIAILREGTVGPALGADSLRQGFRAGIAGLGAVVAAMVTYYQRWGVHATLALLLNGLILLAALSYFGAVLTLPGIAGLILTIGMAVDSNVLVFERIREELRAGKGQAAAVDAGFRHAFRTIIDTHVTTVVACGCLFYFGTSSVRGFALTLMIGLIANVFTSVFVSRLLFDWELRTT